MIRYFVRSCALAGFVLSAASAVQAAPAARYVFFFLGDGMSAAQTQAAEAYLTTLRGDVSTQGADLRMPENTLVFTKFPVLGMQTTYDAGALMTDSASAGTAFACGQKTKSGVIGMDATKAQRLKSIAEIAHDHGRKVGILSSVSLDHATPASYYAKVPNRGYMNEIATQLADSGFEFFGGGGLASPDQAKRKGDTSNDVWALLQANNYRVYNDRYSIMELKVDVPRDSKVVAINPVLPTSSAMPYAIDRPPENLSLAEMTGVATDVLSALGERDGFFMMVEGGKIDWACHANDAVATIRDVFDFADSVGVAMEFYKKHPNETLVVVTGDHETGGMTIGHATTAYTGHYEKLMAQKSSFEHFGLNQWKAYKAAHAAGYDWTRSDNLASSQEMLGLMKDVFGLDWAELNEYQQEKLEAAFDKSMAGENANSKAKNKLLYGYYEPIIVTITHVLNENASVGWTSYSHTGVPVPVYAIGANAQLFSGFYDNTDIAKRLAQAMGFSEQLPVLVD